MADTVLGGNYVSLCCSIFLTIVPKAVERWLPQVRVSTKWFEQDLVSHKSYLFTTDKIFEEKVWNIDGFVGLELPSSHSGLIPCVSSPGFCSLSELQLPPALLLAARLDFTLLLSDWAGSEGRGGRHQPRLQLSVGYLWRAGTSLHPAVSQVTWQDTTQDYKYPIYYFHCRLVCILLSSALCLSSLLLDHRAVALLSCLTNISLPFSRLNEEILGPLEEEIKGLQAFRQPTKVKYTPFTSPRESIFIFPETLYFLMSF